MKLKGKRLLLCLVLSILSVLIISLFTSGNFKTNYSLIRAGNLLLEVEIADTPIKKQKGLMGRNELGENQGMLFIYDKESIYPFWMKDTLIPLDMIWLDKDMKVVEIQENALPCRRDPCDIYMPVNKAQYILEVYGGWTHRHNLNIGDTITRIN